MWGVGQEVAMVMAGAGFPEEKVLWLGGHVLVGNKAGVVTLLVDHCIKPSKETRKCELGG